MRVTNTMLVNDLNRNLNNNMRQMENSQRQLSTGKKLNLPSDNPGGLVNSLRLRTNINEGERYISNLGESINFMETTDSALNNTTQIMHRARELTVKAKTGTNDTGALRALADEIEELNDELKMLANTTYGTKHVFAGTNVTEAPYKEGEDPDNPHQWNGNDRSIEVEISAGITMPMNLNDKDMSHFFMGVEETEDTDGKEGVFDLLDGLVESIREGDSDAMDKALGDLDVKIDDLLSARSTIGARVNRLELQKNRLEDTQISYNELLSQTEDADMAKVIMELKMQENVYRASLSAGARIIQPSLVDFLR
ncbi:Flagellar hook-associated protein FlgL [Candidatus Syntrophocurvum alkaliphilum]|uniref:Flagellar hook-associated protein FlgL n=1 Tax=Candidatus Syntrophocurvum alkaliphilum TaxID=2293317 RepID=A0A6I6DH61_9FIRM|nr:flagellar hook-associated protein FlgL [Candidatus Syntrophocurvum alkaliphilum]QGU00433.1 Flagellar hook-associated protein FlgL [Candidatus Syntrophocurvum alkaliphilum]